MIVLDTYDCVGYIWLCWIPMIVLDTLIVFDTYDCV